VNVLVLQHIACEPPAVYEDVMRERGWQITRVELDEGEQLPDWRAFDAIVAMGGPMGVYERDAHPWLDREVAAIGEAVRAGTPFFGACLGVQLLAAALGGRVYLGPEPEVGVLPVRLTAAGEEDPVTGALPSEVLTLQWHQDTFDLPDGAVQLMESDAYPNQAFRFGRHAYGVQFHLEVDEPLADEWARVPAYEEAAERVLGAGGLDRLLHSFRAQAPTMKSHARTLFTRFAQLAEPAT
jgi:GMP synthase-like glutamine amidotransferase